MSTYSTDQLDPMEEEVYAFAASFAQQRLWFLDQLEPGKPFYTIPTAVRFRGPLHVDALESGLNEIVQRHETLRTTFAMLDGELMQIVMAASQVERFVLTRIDLSTCLPVDLDETIRHHAEAEALQPFELSRGPLIRGSLLWLGEDDHVLLLTMHHIISDGWSMGVLVQELSILYRSFLADQPSPLPALSLQYADYALWQREWLQGEELDRQLTYWKQQLQGAPETVALFTDHPRTPVQTFNGAYQVRVLPLELSKRLKDLTQQEDATLFMTLLAAFKILIARYSGQSDIVVGTPIANRNRAEIEQIIGFFVNTLVLRTDLSGNPSFRQALQRVREVALGAYTHQDLPFEQIVEALQTTRDLSRSPLFQIMFALQNTSTSSASFPDLTISPIAVDNKSAKFDLTLQVVDSDEHIAISLEYNTDLYEASTITQMLAHFQMLLESIVLAPDQSIATLNMMTPTELGTLLTLSDTTVHAYPVNVYVHQLFEQWVKQSPSSDAVVYQDVRWSYDELNQRANQLAYYLREQHVGPDQLVGVCVERSPEMLVALLGILKAGGAYVPLDPDYPTDRLAYMLEDAQVTTLLTQHHLLERLPVSTKQYFCLDTDWPQLEQYPDEDQVIAIEPENLAYMIYTSGSTGRPKGVQISHANLLNLVTWHRQTYNVQPIDRATQLAGIAFDACVWEIWPYLTAGASLYLPDASTRLDPEQLRDWLVRERITLSFMPTPMAEGVLTLSWPATTSLRALLTGGDKLHYYPSEDLPFRLINHYGPTEFTVVTSAGDVPFDTEEERAPSIGRSIANTQTYILDQHLQLVPQGVPGELFVGGASLARGYLHRPDLTAELFVAHPFSAEPGARLYRTGDLVRYLSDGTIEFLGRIDDQVKIRGYRIELGEIEALLLQHEAVRDCSVIVHEDNAGHRRLVAYLVAQEKVELQWEDVRAYLQAQVPEYMVPALMVILEALPLTSNGKVDRRALPAPDLQQLATDENYIAPRTPLEQQLMTIWSQVLGLSQVSIYENFFALGGDSILSIQIVARANQVGLHLTPKLLFRHQTIADLARVIAKDESKVLVEATQGLVSGPVLLTPIGHWFIEQQQPQPNYWNQAILVSVRQRLDYILLEQVVKRLLIHHDALRLRLVRDAERWELTNALPDDAVPLTVLDLSDASTLEQKTVFEKAVYEAQTQLDLAEGPLLRLVYFDFGAQQAGRLLIVVHHLAIDGVSWRILLEDMQTAYTQLDAHESLVLPLKTTSFQQWSAMLHEYAQRPEVQDELDYWLVQSRRQVQPLPIDQSNGENTIASAHTVTVSLSVEETQALLHDVPPVYHTQMNDVLLTALVRTITGWTGQDSVLLHMEGHGREELFDGIDLSRTVGWFTSMYPTLLEASTVSQPGPMLKSIKEQLRALPEHGIRYGLLRYLSDDEQVRKQLRALPQAELSFNYLGQFDQMVSTDSMFGAAGESTGLPMSPLSQRAHLLDITCSISGGQLTISWMYSRNFYRIQTITMLAQDFVRSLRELITHCSAKDAGGYTPSDFPLATLTQAQLDRLLGNNRDIEAVYPLSSLQQGLLFHTLYSPDDGDYIVQIGSTFKGTLHCDAFKEAWQQVIDHHSILRTAFELERLDEPQQIVYRHSRAPFFEYDWRQLTADEQEVRLTAYWQEDRRRGFDIAEPPLMRFSLLRLTDDTYEFIWSHHHVLLDGWSMPTLLQDVFMAYEALCRHEKLQLTYVRPYQDYIQWLSQQDMGQAEVFWRKMLEGFTTPTQLLIERSVAADEAPHYEEALSLFSEELTLQLQQFSRKQQLTINTLIQGAWAIVLSRYSGQPDVIFGTTVSGRPADLAGVEAMVGLFINTLPIRVRIELGQNILSWLHQLQEQQLEMRQYEYSPLAQVQGWSEIPRGTSLFDSLFVFENYPVTTQNIQAQAKSDLELLAFQAQEQTNYPLCLVAHAAQQLSLKFIYDSRRFTLEHVKSFQMHMQTLLDAFINTPEQQVATVSLLNPAAHLQLRQWNMTSTDYPRDVSIPALFEEHVKRTPEATAVIYADQRLSYAELNARANQMAHYLSSLGVGIEDLVGFCLERSIDMLISILGILKAGGVYVPLDPAYPQERLSMMVEDSRIKVLLTLSSMCEIPGDGRVQVVHLDQVAEVVATMPAENLLRRVYGDNLLYVMYTSGSTGRPKGVAITHQATIRLVRDTNYLHVQPDDRVVQAANVAFDGSTFELWGPWLNGACLVMLMNDDILSPQRLAQVLQEQKITILFLTTALLNQIAREMPEIFSSLRCLLFGGEAADVRWVRQILNHGAPEKIVNAYGPTESTAYATCYVVKEVEDAATTLPIGPAIANTTLYVLDKHFQAVPIGVPGELYIGGDGLARGYLRRPELTAEYFIPNHLSDQPGERLYKTGDLVRFDADGALTFIGRVDHQVKIRGHRIETGEIEAQLKQYSHVSDALVLVREDVHGNKSLVAYIESPVAAGLTIGDLRIHLQAQLPDYMVPAVFVLLNTFPLTPNGKIDRRALPSPDESHIGHDGMYTAPRNEVETKLADIWHELLGIEQVSIHDNFFMLGGDSILSIQIVARARHVGIQLTPKQMFQHPTIAELAVEVSAIDGLAAATTEQGIVTGVVPLTPIQHWFFDQRLPQAHHYNQALILSARERLDRELLEQTARYIVQHHDALRMRYVERYDGWQQSNDDIETHEFVSVKDIASLLAQEQKAAIEATANDVQISLSLQDGPLLRIVHFISGPDQQDRLLLVIHHLVVDGISWRILLEDFSNVYEQLRDQQALALPAKTTSFQQWSKKLVEYAQTPMLQQELPYWLTALRQDVSPLPLDYTSGENTVASVQTISVSLGADETQALLQQVPQAYHTQINDVLLTTLLVALTQWTGQRAFLIDLEGHGREDMLEHVDISRTVGWFTSMYPLLLDAQGKTELTDILKVVKEQLRELPQHGIGFGLLRYLSQDQQIVDQLGALPQPEISFNYLGQFDQEFSEQSLFAPAYENSGMPVSPLGIREHQLDISGSVSGEQLHLNWVFSTNLHRPETITALADSYIQILQRLIARCSEENVGGYTPSDIPLAKLTQEQIDQVLGSDRSIETVYPLSPLQQGLLFHSLYTLEDGDYIVQTNFTFRGHLQVDVFQQAWQQVVKRYAILRTAFVWEGLPEPQQIVHAHVEVPFVLHDWRGYTLDEQQQRLTELRQQDRRQGFVLSQAPLLRLTMIRLTDTVYEFLWSHHHLLLDGWSMPIVLKDVFICYEALIHNHQPQLDRIYPYQNYIAWLTEQDLQKAEVFWRHMLKGFVTPVVLGVERSKRLQLQDDRRYQECKVSLSKEMTLSLQDLARTLQLTLNTLMQGAWALLLSHYSAQDDIVFGATLSGRSADVQRVESMVGLFINTLPVRIRVRPEIALTDWLQEIQEQQSELRQYEYSPLVQVQGWSELARGVALFDTLFVFENYPISGSEVQDVQASLQLEAVSSQEQTHYPLTLYIIPGERLTLKLLYDHSRFEATMIEQMTLHLQHLLQGLLERPSQVVGRLPLLSDSEQQILLVERNRTQAQYPTDLCLHEIFEQQAKRTPTEIAVTFAHDSLTYQDLDRKTNQLACYLRSLGVGPEVPVGISVEPSIELVIAILGIFKAGGIYVPLDPAYPTARLAYMLQDTALDICLTQKHLTASLPEHPMHVVELDDIWEQIARLPGDSICSGVTLDNLAYIIYTSGSTGNPKGVMANHRASVNRFDWMWREYPFAVHEHCCQKTALNFVDSIWELLGSVLRGVPVTIISKEARQDPLLLIQALADCDCTRIVLVPSLLRAMLESVPDLQARLPKLRLWVCSGERLSFELAQRFKEYLPQSRLLNLYGSSEVTADVTHYDTAQLTEDLFSVPIGTPIANMRVYVLDQHHRLAPIGVPGELCVGGIGLARGYLNRPEMTAASFIPDPFSALGGDRLYCTGDLVRYLSDGQLEYVGRIDQQVKIRGVRIEPGEIESALYQHVAVQAAIVLAQQDQSGESRLVAYVVAEKDEQLFVQLRADLQRRLPAYMLPASFVRLDALPLLPGGKVNRHALSILDVEQEGVTSAYIAPRTPMEELLVDIWADVLKREQIGVQDNFFEIGGHSLLATQVISRIRLTFQVELPVRSIFESPTVETMIIAIAKEQLGQADDDELSRLLAELDDEDDE